LFRLLILLLIASCRYGASEAKIYPFVKDTVLIPYFSKVGTDSAYIYFTDDFRFTEVGCASIVRKTALNSRGFQSGTYKDYVDNNLIGMGGYQSGLRNGKFETYYKDGKIKSQGQFVDDEPTGEWIYFEPHGALKRQLTFASGKMSILFASRNGKATIEHGSGKFEGTFFSLALNEEMFVSGEVKNGLMEGKWRIWQIDEQGRNQPFSIEYFNEGKFIFGSLSSAGNRFQREYHTKSIVTLLESEYYFTIEQGRVIACEDAMIKKPKLLFIARENPELGYINMIENMVAKHVRKGYLQNRSTKSEQIYSLLIDQKGEVKSFKTMSSEDVYPMNDALRDIILFSRWNPGENKSGPIESTALLIFEFEPYLRAPKESMNHRPFTVKVRSK
jgi:antitoxin component YwqK of YwqJK toxin-antitoxin module